MSYFLEERPKSPNSRLAEKVGKRRPTNGSGHHESEDVWNHGYNHLFATTVAADYTIKKVDPRAKPQRPIKSGIFGAGIDHVSFLEFEDAEIIFRRRLGLPVKQKKNDKEAEKVRLTSTHRQDFTASGFVVDEESARGKPAGRPTQPSDDCEPFCLLSTNQHKEGEVDGGWRQNGHVKR